MRFPIAVLFLFLAHLGMSQATCDMRVADSSYFHQVNSQIQNVVQSKSLNDVECNKLRTVVHVVYNGAIDGYYRGEISPAQVKSQIRITNQFLRNDSLMESEGNTPLGYELVLASTDPDGNPTTGIIYHDGTEIFGQNWNLYGLKNNNSQAISASELAETLGWGEDLNGKEYINTYVVSSLDGNTGGGVQAYAYFPTPNPVYGNYNLFNTFGAEQLQEESSEDFDLKSYTDLGLTYTHELLHNLALFHTFQGNSCAPEINPNVQGDRVVDTPPQTQGSSCYGSCGFLSHNVMDYISQSCKDRITPGQAERAHAAIQNSLAEYLVCTSDPGCITGNGDFNNDGMFTIIDLSMLNPFYGTAANDGEYDAYFDVNCDGVINLSDVSVANQSN